jgi:hypothetical protein
LAIVFTLKFFISVLPPAKDIYEEYINKNTEYKNYLRYIKSEATISGCGASFIQALNHDATDLQARITVYIPLLVEAKMSDSEAYNTTKGFYEEQNAIYDRLKNCNATTTTTTKNELDTIRNFIKEFEDYYNDTKNAIKDLDDGFPCFGEFSAKAAEQISLLQSYSKTLDGPLNITKIEEDLAVFSNSSQNFATEYQGCIDQRKLKFNTYHLQRQ